MYRCHLLVALTLTVLVACSNATDESTDLNSDDADTRNFDNCGPNAIDVTQQGIDPQCVCLMGFRVIDGVCQPEGTSSDMTMAEMTELPDLPDSRALPESCFIPPRSYCDPRSGEGCDLAAGETCDLATTQGQVVVACLPGPNTAMRGDACRSATGPFCSVGLRCTEAERCAAFCCADEDCDRGEICAPFSNLQSLGVCEAESITPPDPNCGPSGTPCLDGRSCCSGECTGNMCL